MSGSQKMFMYKNQKVRVAVKGDFAWFVAEDVCNAMGIKGIRTALNRLGHNQKSVSSIDTLGGMRRMCVINEAGLHGLVATSRSPEAQQFADWVTQEVFPTIHGAADDIFVDMYLQHAEDSARETFRSAIETIAIMEPKSQTFDGVVSGKHSQSMNEVAKSFGTGRNTLFGFLRSINVLMADNLPYQQYLTAGYFEVVEAPKVTNGAITDYPTTRVTAKGTEFIERKLREHGRLRAKEASLC
ncbi:phage antirepressor KilAC domain-containing protein [Brevibacillus daliensis]|uniref:phage antirepressor KilAC domain-containing protein n=1 Tax=Brevibacillus daliensis TaxID=2892995 RepID=UPI001E3F3948|nr:phage antirepressor KilAC domain-containing protein [Brevibacillus daliensis]